MRVTRSADGRRRAEFKMKRQLRCDVIDAGATARLSSRPTMSSQRRRPARAVIALLLLAGLGAAVAGQAVHTDDGCAVETHCVACRQAVASIAVTTPPVVLTPAFDQPVGPAHESATGETAGISILREPSRGPPEA